MYLKKCENCGKEMEAKLPSKRFCSRFCNLKKYFSNPEKLLARKEYNKRYMDDSNNKKKLKEWRKDYLKKPEIKEKNRVLAITKYKERRREYWKEYGKRPEVRKRINEKDRTRRREDENYAIIDRLRRSLNHALTKYTKEGKIMKSKKYGINWNEIIENLKPFPKDITLYEIDHMRPLHSFNLNNKEEIKKAFAPSNLQWLTIEENRFKSGKIISNTTKGGEIKFLISA
ncbi:hypothetical protein HOD29_02095 [archaeon]|jgi:hypothetical protein|nr:hypothetical protein [archaeon]